MNSTYLSDTFPSTSNGQSQLDMKFATTIDMNSLNAPKDNKSTDQMKEIDMLKIIGDNNSEKALRTTNEEVSCSNSENQMRIPICFAKISSNDKKKDIYMIAEGYHKTDSCYYKTLNGGYHKLPPDSYHKMSEICYKKLPDGTFKRLVDFQNEEDICSKATNVTSTGTQNKVRDNVIKFLKRSKSHSQATAKENYVAMYRKEIQQKTEKRWEIRQDVLKSSDTKKQNHEVSGKNNFENKNITYNKRHSTHSGDRKVVVTMMENGGLPIVATSKSKTPKIEYKSNQQNSSIHEKVNLAD